MRRLACLQLLSAVVALCPGPMGAAAQELSSISAAELLRRVGEDPARAAAIAAEVELARAERRAAAAWTNPTLAYDREEVFVDGDGQPEDFVRLTLPIEISGRRSRSIDAAEAEIEAARAEAVRTRLEQQLDVLEIFVEAAHARLVERALAEDGASLDALVTAGEARTKAGEASGQDLVRLRIERAMIEDLRAEAEETLQRARRRLAVAAGEPEKRLDAADDLTLSPEPPPIESLVARAAEQRADLLAARSRKSAAEHAAAAAAWSWVPALELSGGLKSAAIGEGRALGYVAGVAIELPFFDRGGAAQDRAQALARRFGADADLISRRIAAEVEAAREQLISRRKRAEKMSQQTLADSRALLSSSRAAYREGEWPVFELIDAQRAAREAQLRALDLLRDVRLAELVLWRVIGARVEGTEPP